MARRRFFVDEVRRGMAEIAGEDAEHLVRVLRVEPGQRFELSDNQRVYLGRVEEARKSLVSFVVEQELPPSPATREMHLCAALFKFDRFEWLIEKATELGVAVIQPVTAARSEHGLDRAAAKRHARWEKIALEASQQARRDRLPVVAPLLSFASAIGEIRGARLLLDERESERSLLSQLPASTEPVSLLLGPEGGWTDAERSAAIEHGWQPATLGPSILRAETAGIAALAIVAAAGTVET